MENGLTIVSVYAIIEKNNQILLTEDEGKPGWKLPGGRVEEKELILDGLKREIKEEIGLDINPTGLVSIQNYIRNDGTIRIRIYFSAKHAGGGFKHMAGEVKRSQWMPKENLRKLEKNDFFIEQYHLAIQEYLEGRVYPISVIKELLR